MSSTGYVIPIDPSELASRFSDPEMDPRFDEEDDIVVEDEISNVSSEAFLSYLPEDDYENKIVPLLDRIPDKEADFIHLYFIEKKRQADIATIFGITQAAVSYRLVRGLKRIKFLLSIPQVSEDELRKDLPQVFPTKVPCARCRGSESTCLVCEGEGTFLIDVEILVGMWVITCQSEVAKKLGLTQGRVRHRFFKAVQILEEMATKDSHFAPYQQIFSSLAAKNFNMLREVRLPQWSDRGGDECL